MAAEGRIWTTPATPTGAGPTPRPRLRSTVVRRESGAGFPSFDGKAHDIALAASRTTDERVRIIAQVDPTEFVAEIDFTACIHADEVAFDALPEARGAGYSVTLRAVDRDAANGGVRPAQQEAVRRQVGEL